MNNKDILQKAIEKAVENGYAPTDNGGEVAELKHTNGGCWFFDSNETGSHYDMNDIIFSHDFAKAFWKEPTEVLIEKAAGHEVYGIADWEYHLQQLALAKDRLEYIGRFI